MVNAKSRDEVLRLVAAGYDRIADRYEAWSRSEVVDDVKPAFVAELLDELDVPSRILDLGCGSGETLRLFAARGHAVTGVDLSAAQVRRARRTVPSGTFIHADMASVEFAESAFDAALAFYSMTHLPAGDLPGVLGRLARWIRPGGRFVGTVAARAGSGIEPDWLGVPMYFSGESPDATLDELRRAGFEVERFETRPITEAGIPVDFTWIRGVVR